MQIIASRLRYMYFGSDWDKPPQEETEQKEIYSVLAKWINF